MEPRELCRLWIRQPGWLGTELQLWTWTNERSWRIRRQQLPPLRLKDRSNWDSLQGRL